MSAWEFTFEAQTHGAEMSLIYIGATFQRHEFVLQK